MKKLIIRACLCIVPFLIYLGTVLYVDVFNVFHRDNIRITDAARNDNYIKTRYIIDNSDKYNSFILGSSRVGNIPPQGLISNFEGEELHWYNMTYPMGCPKDNLETVKTFLENGVDIKCLVIGIDEISMYNTYENNSSELIEKQYQEYEKSPLSFWYKYIMVKPEFSILSQVISQDENDAENVSLFYEYGVDKRNIDISEPSKEKTMVKSLGCGYYFEERSESEPINAIKELKEICDEKGIRLIIFSSPVLESTYEEAVSKGYIEFLEDVAAVTDFYNFSGLNQYTTNMKYYFDASHYDPFVGLKIEEIIFADEHISDVKEFGAYITKDNASELISYLKGE